MPLAKPRKPVHTNRLDLTDITRADAYRASFELFFCWGGEWRKRRTARVPGNSGRIGYGKNGFARSQPDNQCDKSRPK